MYEKKMKWKNYYSDYIWLVMGINANYFGAHNYIFLSIHNCWGDFDGNFFVINEYNTLDYQNRQYSKIIQQIY